jgi:ATP-dependent RNA helicase DeaD
LNFAELNLSSNINKAIAELGFTKATDIQAEAIPFLMDYPHDFIGQAQTGTGKTAAFVIPLLEKIDEDKKNIQAIVLAPTRELAQQVEKQIYLLTKFMKIKSMTVYGGVSYDKQIGNLKKLKPQIVVATPGRFIDLMDRGVLKLSSADTLVIDEADEMLNMGFLEDVEKIIDSLPKKRQVWMFSATMPNEIKRLIEQTFNAPEMIKVKSETLSNANIDQRFCVLQRRDFLKGLRLVLGSNPDAYGIVFCETRAETTKVAEILDGYGIKANALNGDLSQAARDRALERFRDKKVKLLICTDVAARGIDISNITHVF